MPLVESFSGIRGIYNDGLDEQVAIRYAYSYLSFIREKYGDKARIAIGMDTRPSGKILKNVVLEALDCDIIDIGIASTPMAEFSVRHYKADGGIIITASHNEPYWNGFKFLDKDGAVLSPKDMETIIKVHSKLKKLSFNADAIRANKARVIKKYDETNKKYSEYVLGFLPKEDKDRIKKAKLRVVLDPNGGTGTIAKPILESLGVRVKGINMEHGIFSRPVEPTESSLIYLTNAVREGKYDFAAGFDCDADRVEIVTGKGIVSGNELLALVADDVLANSKNKTIVVNNATSLAVREIARKHDAKYIETEVGEANVVEAMKKSKAAIGGEGSSSGIIIPSSRCRDGVLTLVYILKIMASRKEGLEKLIAFLPPFCSVKSKITINPKQNDQIMKKLADYYKGKKYKIIKSDTSLKAMPDNNSFIWFRASKTENDTLRIIGDAMTRKKAQELVDEALKITK